jgi:hypothetical protein
MKISPANLEKADVMPLQSNEKIPSPSHDSIPSFPFQFAPFQVPNEASADDREPLLLQVRFLWTTTMRLPCFICVLDTVLNIPRAPRMLILVPFTRVTVTPSYFLFSLLDGGTRRVVPLRLAGEGSIPQRPVAMTADTGQNSVITHGYQR